jgi:hypothetical protein
LEVDQSGLTLPAQITIPGNQADLVFPIGAIDNAIVDGERTITIQGVILESNGAAQVGLATPAAATVTDDDGPTLKLVLDRNLVGEGVETAATGTVSRNTPTALALTVQLASSDTTELTTPLDVVIPAGSDSATFPVTSINDGVTDGSQNVTVTASSAGFTSGSANITVSDVNLPDLVVTKSEGPASADSDSYVSVTYRIANQGSEPAGNAWTTRVFLSTDPVPGDDLLVGNYCSGHDSVGLYFEQSVSVRVPTASGKYCGHFHRRRKPGRRRSKQQHDDLRSTDRVHPAHAATVATPRFGAVRHADSDAGQATRSSGGPAPEGCWSTSTSTSTGRIASFRR